MCVYIYVEREIEIDIDIDKYMPRTPPEVLRARTLASEAIWASLCEEVYICMYTYIARQMYIAR